MLCGLPLVQQAVIGNCLSFESFSFDHNGLAPVPTINSVGPAHNRESGGASTQERPCRGFCRGQHGLALDAPLKLFVQTFNRIRSFT